MKKKKTENQKIQSRCENREKELSISIPPRLTLGSESKINISTIYGFSVG